MSMSRKDYEAIADIMAKAYTMGFRDGQHPSGLIAWTSMEMSRYFAKDNPRFDSAKFLAAIANGAK